MARLRPNLRTPTEVYAGVSVVLTAIYFALGHGSIAQSVVYDGIAVASGLAIVAGVALNRPARPLPWLLFAAGQLSFAIGDVIFDVYERLGGSPPTPSAADVFYLSGYPFIAAGLVLLIRGLGIERRLAGFVDAGIVSVAFALLQWVFLMDGPVHDQTRSVADRAVNAVAYPAGDIVLLAALAAFFITPAWRTPSYRWLAAALIMLLVADEIYGLSSDTYSSGDWVDAAYMLSYAFFAAAALHPSMRNLGVHRRQGRRRISAGRAAVLAGALLTAPAALLVQRLRGAPLDVFAVVSAAGATSLLVVARMTGIVRALEGIRVRERAARAEAEAARRQLAEQNERLREADRLKDEFVAMISHDLRTPLTSIMGFLELALDKETGPLNEEQRSYLEVVSRNSERLLRLVDDLLFAARLRSGGLELARQELDLGPIVRQACDESKPCASSHGVELVLDLAQAPPVLGDRGRLFQLLDNLISNGVKFTPEGGTVTVAVRPAGDRVALEVRDTGIGIPAAEEERLFERFFRASTAVDRQIPGTGLGLYIARAIVDAHEGTISVESEVGSGTTFRIELPAAVRAEQPAEELVR